MGDLGLEDRERCVSAVQTGSSNAHTSTTPVQSEDMIDKVDASRCLAERTSSPEDRWVPQRRPGAGTQGRQPRRSAGAGLVPNVTTTARASSASVDTSKAASRGHFKTGHHGAGRDHGGVTCGDLFSQVGVQLGPPAPRTALEDVSLVEKPVE
jgi:hypothetical protein